ncbi:hypothetical protein E3E22_07140 [Thermococcus sp. MV5]|uniref:hypothetical protein n=1 Tax=Thermococcus sp. MV5 TaxID=1638272 RepID=UPI0014397DE9|nr:hypothetical protein [Thermococcus sp. MV5]NJE26395.1 hypothetical protein [Thermococcus sp. MV5]
METLLRYAVLGFYAIVILAEAGRISSSYLNKHENNLKEFILATAFFVLYTSCAILLNLRLSMVFSIIPFVGLSMTYKADTSQKRQLRYLGFALVLISLAVVGLEIIFT